MNRFDDPVESRPLDPERVCKLEKRDIFHSPARREVERRRASRPANEQRSANRVLRPPHVERALGTVNEGQVFDLLLPESFLHDYTHTGNVSHHQLTSCISERRNRGLDDDGLILYQRQWYRKDPGPRCVFLSVLVGHG